MRPHFRVDNYSRFIDRWPRVSIYTRGITGTGTLHLVVSFTPTKTRTFELWFFMGRGPGRARTILALP
jgi:phage terminase large subunit-like protein